MKPLAKNPQVINPASRSGSAAEGPLGEVAAPMSGRLSEEVGAVEPPSEPGSIEVETARFKSGIAVTGRRDGHSPTCGLLKECAYPRCECDLNGGSVCPQSLPSPFLD